MLSLFNQKTEIKQADINIPNVCTKAEMHLELNYILFMLHTTKHKTSLEHTIGTIYMLAREWSDHSCLKEFRLADAKTVLSATIKYAAPATAIGKTRKERGKEVH